MKQSQHIPEPCLNHLLDDGLFASAYDALLPGHRAWLKKLAAELHAMISGTKRSSSFDQTSWSPGFMTGFAGRPAEAALLFIGAEVSSSVQVAAAALPPLLFGVREVAAVRVGNGGDAPDHILAALELCGVENVSAMSGPEASACLSEALADPDCACLCLGGTDWHQGPWIDCRPPAWRVLEMSRMAVFVSRGAGLDFEVMAWAHPGARFFVYGDAPRDLPRGFEPVSGGLEALLEALPQVAFWSDAPPQEVMGRIPLILGPGQEGCFIWPGLTRRHLFVESLAVWDGGGPLAQTGGADR